MDQMQCRRGVLQNSKHRSNIGCISLGINSGGQLCINGGVTSNQKCSKCSKEFTTTRSNYRNRQSAAMPVPEIEHTNCRNDAEEVKKTSVAAEIDRGRSRSDLKPRQWSWQQHLQRLAETSSDTEQPALAKRTSKPYFTTPHTRTNRDTWNGGRQHHSFKFEASPAAAVNETIFMAGWEWNWGGLGWESG
ncbi:hypothetical protein PIB30_014812 [Stylosanthes scabra]|uniref:Uncharacterized protein n=1 Tax=Stylosanthes scabra TaxID=79078 RepID=A0ABU6Q7K9_9FABA|nr:hypothetical protein [Stylosanthes scabra]